MSHASYLEKGIEACQHEYLESERGGGDDNSNKTSKLSALSARQLHLPYNETNNVPPRVLCIEAICDVITEQLPDLWRLGQSYFTGQLHVAVDTKKQEPFKV